jgi:hypothetical protein
MAETNDRRAFEGEPLGAEQAIPGPGQVNHPTPGVAVARPADGVVAAGAAETDLPRATGESKPVPLSNGVTAHVRVAAGRDLLLGSQLGAALGATPLAGLFGVAAAVTTVNGRKLTVEEMLDMPGGDVGKLIEASAGNELSSVLGT